jgi:hypothetical protein
MLSVLEPGLTAKMNWEAKNEQHGLGKHVVTEDGIVPDQQEQGLTVRIGNLGGPACVARSAPQSRHLLSQ